MKRDKIQQETLHHAFNAIKGKRSKKSPLAKYANTTPRFNDPLSPRAEKPPANRQESQINESTQYELAKVKRQLKQVARQVREQHMQQIQNLAEKETSGRYYFTYVDQTGMQEETSNDYLQLIRRRGELMARGGTYDFSDIKDETQKKSIL